MDIHIDIDYVGNYVATDLDNYCGCVDCNDPIGVGRSREEAVRDLYSTIMNIDILSFDEVKYLYSTRAREYTDFQEFLHTYFTPMYDNELNLIGYEQV